MKCANCGYFNLPGAQICGRCSRSLEVTAIANQADDIMPPRRSQRSARANFEASIPPVARQLLRRESPFARHRTRTTLPQSEETWAEFTTRATTVLLSIVPGLSQVLGKRYLMAAGFFAFSLTCLVGFALTFYQQASDVFLWSMIILSFASIFENLSYDDSGRRSLIALRLIRHGFFSILYLATLGVFFFSYLQYQFTPFQVGDTNYTLTSSDFGYPVVRVGDNLIFENFDSRRVHRGDIVLQEDDEIHLEEYDYGYGRTRNQNALWKVVGLPGDMVTSRLGVLYVNDKPVPQSWVPAYFKAPDGISKRVPSGELALVGVLFGYRVQPHEFSGPPSRFNTLPYSKLTRRMLAIIGPPQRRQLFR